MWRSALCLAEGFLQTLQPRFTPPPLRALANGTRSFSATVSNLPGASKNCASRCGFSACAGGHGAYYGSQRSLRRTGAC